MADQPGAVAPASYPIRDFRKPSQEAGVIFNQPSFAELGGLTSASQYPDKDTQSTKHFKVEKPTNVNPARRSAREIGG